jgi:hypothetical protein
MALGLLDGSRLADSRRLAATIAALLLIPIALTLSVACTVAYQWGLPPLF